MALGVKLRFADFVVLFLAVFITVFISVKVYAFSPAGVQFIIQGGRESWVFNGDRNEVIEVTGPLGKTAIEINNGLAQVIASPCANQSCVSAGTISRHSEWIACLPNAVLVRAEGTAAKAEEELDGIVY